jgi:cytosine/adenosine deaminase-related metal-dependent hydrolase
VVLAKDGVVLDVGPASEIVPRHGHGHGLQAERIPGVVMPGLINAHTHLELSALRGCVPGGAGFVPWVEALVGARLEVQPDEEGDAIVSAVSDLVSFGTVAVGEVTNSLAAVSELARQGLQGCIFHEVFGVGKDAVLRRVEGLREEALERLAHWPSDGLRYSMSPHTLYSTHPDAVRAILQVGRGREARMSLHLAEHPAERRALEQGDGPILRWYKERLKLTPAEDFWPHQGPVHYADTLGALAEDVILVHLADAREAELARVAERGAPVVLCPRSNLYIETRLPPVLAMRAAGLAPALGTDSLASNGSLDVLAEARALADRFPSVPAAEWLTMATWNGAKVLGRRDLGRVAVGARPGLFALEGTVSSLSTDAVAEFVLKNVKAPRRWLDRGKATFAVDAHRSLA